MSRGPYAKGISRRQTILETALEIFAEKGLEGTSLTAIGEAAGVTREGMRHYFSSKEDLLLAALMDAEDRARSDAPHPDSAGVMERIISSAEHISGVPGLISLYMTLLAGSVNSGSARSRALFAERFDRLRTELTSAIEQAQACGEIRQDVSAEALASLIIGASDGLSMQGLLAPRIDVPNGMRLLQELLRL